MGIKNYLIDGVSGTGKTAVAEELEQRGFHVVHGDRELAYVGDPLTGEALGMPPHLSDADAAAWLNKHWIWPLAKVVALIADKSHFSTFFCGASRNSSLFIDLFDEVFILNVDLDTLMQRLARRQEDEFGGRVVEKQLIARLHATHEDIPTKGIRIDATPPIADVVEDILSKS